MNNFLETNRLILKAPAQKDLHDILDLRQDSKVMQFVGRGRVETIDEVEQFLQIAIAYQTKYGFGFCSVFEKESGEFVGQAGLFHLGFDETQQDFEIAYRLKQKFWGKGYATELAKGLINWGFTHLTVEKLVALAWPGNVRSQHVLEKAGLTNKGLIHFRDREVLYYEIYKPD
jgi:RimJ/RimL family protein N-acetyltransferase